MLKLPSTKKEDAFSRIQELALQDNGSCIEILEHAIMRIDERGISIRQVMNVLKFGNLESTTWCNESENGWKCKISRITAGAKVTVVAKLVERDDEICLIVTAWS